MPPASHVGGGVAITPCRRGRAFCTMPLRRAATRRCAPRPIRMLHGQDAIARRQAMTISTLLTPDLVLPALAADTMAAVLDALAARVAATHPHVDAQRLAGALHARERVSSTALEDGIAIPHARLERLD